jgi:mRNA-degrading endonuclease RelE of RelBE toxin-antitoxin system
MVRGELTALWLYADKLPPDYDGSPGAFGYHPPVVFNAPFIPMPGEEAPRFWLLGMSMEFRKAIRGIDRKLQGRILEAIDDISAQPITPRGDTVKRLTGDFKNFWRYRIGDFRLVYLPDAERRHVTLKTFAARGGVYD